MIQEEYQETGRSLPQDVELVQSTIDAVVLLPYLKGHSLILVMRPHPQHFDNAFILENLIDQPMLKVNSAGVDRG